MSRCVSDFRIDNRMVQCREGTELTSVWRQNSGSLQQVPSRTASGLRLGFMCTAPYDDVNTTRRTPMSAAAFITFLVPSTAVGTRFCSKRISSSHLVIGHRGGDVEDAMASGERGA
uniref:Uncharacterized protein n=1 Tax=Oryza meridionalis TaxID=40149 RepID=A0A0E0CSY3_9ORYZ